MVEDDFNAVAEAPGFQEGCKLSLKQKWNRIAHVSVRSAMRCEFMIYTLHLTAITHSIAAPSVATPSTLQPCQFLPHLHCLPIRCSIDGPEDTRLRLPNELPCAALLPSVNCSSTPNCFSNEDHTRPMPVHWNTDLSSGCLTDLMCDHWLSQMAPEVMQCL